MPTWSEILIEINGGPNTPPNPIDDVRRKYVAQLGAHTGRNVIAYYSGWLVPKADDFNVSISDLDKHALMSVVYGLDKEKGLDLVLHTPGGSIDATESIVDYLWTVFDKDIRVIVPQLAMSAGTMIACSAKEIIMGKHSNLGPIDPQMFSPGVGFNVPAQGVLDEYQVALDQIKTEPSSVPLWQTIFSRVHPSFINECMLAITHSKQLVKQWLLGNMLASISGNSAIADKIVDNLSDHGITKSHGRHISRVECSQLGLNIFDLEQDSVMQDIVLSIHHAFMITFSQTQARKIVENNNGLTNVSMIPLKVLPQQGIFFPPNIVSAPLSPVPTIQKTESQKVGPIRKLLRLIKSLW